MGNKDFTFLTGKQLSDNKIDIIKKRGRKAAITDFSILLGGYVSDTYIDNDTSLEGRAGYYWTKTSGGFNNCVRLGTLDGNIGDSTVYTRDNGARPALPFSSISNIPTNGVSREAKKSKDGILEVEYGYYPQKAVSKILQNRLEQAYKDGNIKETGNKYTTDSRRRNEYDETFSKRELEEFEFEGHRYVRVEANFCDEDCTLSNGENYNYGDIVWVEVSPVKWLVDEKEKIMLSDKILFAGIQFNNAETYDGNFEETDIKRFMDNYFSKEITAGIGYEIEEEKETTRRRNPYGFDFADVKEEEIIKGCIESNIPVFLHGKPGDGKSARIKQIDSDCEIIYMRNATPDSLCGKSAIDSSTGKMTDIPPTWYEKIKEKCEKDPENQHIIFFDELTNALPSMQAMAFNIVLDGEVNGKWKLPQNARIVAAGNELEDSLAANQMAEPLYDRFAHVYIETRAKDWLDWASKNNIHPAIYAYIAYGGDDVLRTDYNGKTPNADPRKWEKASDVLYATNKPEMLRALIGEDLTRDFIAFVNEQVVTVEDVINHNYTKRDLEMNSSQRYATALSLSSVSEEHFEIVREFMKLLGDEAKSTFESMWTHGDEKRLEKLMEIRMSEENISQGGIER